MTQEDEQLIDQEPSNQKQIKNFSKVRNILLMVLITIIWTVSAVFSLIDAYNGLGILETPWILLSIFLTIAIILIVIIPLFRNLKSGVRDALAEKERQKDIEGKE